MRGTATPFLLFVCLLCYLFEMKTKKVSVKICNWGQLGSWSPRGTGAGSHFKLSDLRSMAADGVVSSSDSSTKESNALVQVQG